MNTDTTVWENYGGLSADNAETIAFWLEGAKFWKEHGNQRQYESDMRLAWWELHGYSTPLPTWIPQHPRFNTD